MNMSASVPKGGPNQELSNADFEAIADFALREFGLNLPATKRQLVQSRLSRRLRVLMMPDFKTYRAFFEGINGESERIEILSALTTNVTKFFREIHHFEYLADDVLPDLVSRAQNGERIRIWSAGCSSGQEPYSIALAALKCDPNIGKRDFKILATDIDPVVVKKGIDAKYIHEEMEGVPALFYRKSDIIRMPVGQSGEFTLSEEAKSLVTFGVLNLIREFPFSGSFNVIFCRNVAIYFNRGTQVQVWQRFEKLLAQGGKLFIGHSERINTADFSGLKPVGITVYQKV